MNTGQRDRPDPQALLSEITRERQGALKVFIGASPGVGKTFKMLEAAREARRQGADLVIGIIESHGRQETEDLCLGLERIPLMQVEYRGTQFREMDLDAILKRRPAIVLVDELAHRNIPGTRHPRRYQDIEELLAQGIDVWTTVNIQHLDSLNDVVARITGVRMRETVPDALLSAAQDVVLVDLTPRELVERLRQGKVYVPEQARAALDGFFNPTNLAALRELALRTVAERIDRDVIEAMRRRGTGTPWPVRSRVLVAVDGGGGSEELVRFGRRFAEHRRAPWSAVFVDRGDTDPERRSGVERAFQLAERMGGETATVRGHDAVTELLGFAREHNATTIVVGRARPRPLAGLFGRTVSQRLLREGGEFEITFVAAPTARPRRRRALPGRPAEPVRDYLLALAMVAAAVVIAMVLEPLLPLASLSMVFLTGVLVVAIKTSTRPALFAVALSALVYNFFFTEPLHSVVVYNTEDVLTIVFFLVMGLIGGRLAAQQRRQMQALRNSNEQIQTLLGVSRKLATAADLQSVYGQAVSSVATHAQAPVVLLVPQETRPLLELTAVSSETIKLEWETDDKARSAAQWAFDHCQPSGFNTDTLGGIDWHFLPLAFEHQCFGVIGVYFGMHIARQEAPTGEQLATINALVNHATAAIARARLAGSLEQAKISEETERLRSALLSSVSHDLRTPLSSMLGAASSLRTLGADLTQEDQAELLDSIINEGERLNRYIQNLLDMTQLGYGALKLERGWIGIDDIVDSALRRTRDLVRGHRLVRSIARDLPLLYVHPALIEQALVNVIENAAKFSPPGGEIRVAAAREDGELLVAVSDQGPGIPPEERERVFDMFYTGGDANRDRGKYGSGLGLAICRGMIAAHGGRIEALPGEGGRGTTIAMHLPLMEQPAAEAEETA